MTRSFRLLAGSLLIALLAGCETTPPGIQAAKVTMAQRYAAEMPGDYFIGRRYYKPDFKFWGYIRRPGQPWSESQLVLLNEKQKLAPDRERSFALPQRRAQCLRTHLARLRGRADEHSQPSSGQAVDEMHRGRLS